MTKQELATLGFRLLGIYLIAASFLALGPSLSAVLSGLYRGDAYATVDQAVSLTGMLLFELVIGSGLAWRSEQLAVRTFPDASDRVVSMSGEASSVQAVAISILGACLIAFAVPTFLAGVVTIAYSWTADLPHDYWQYVIRPNWTALVEPFVQLLLGTALFLGAEQIAGSWDRRPSPSSASIAWLVWTAMLAVCLLLFRSYRG